VPTVYMYVPCAKGVHEIMGLLKKVENNDRKTTVACKNREQHKKSSTVVLN